MKDPWVKVELRRDLLDDVEVVVGECLKENPVSIGSKGAGRMMEECPVEAIVGEVGCCGFLDGSHHGGL